MVQFGTPDGVIRLLFLFIIGFVFIYYSSLLEEEYHQKLAQLYLYPWWRFLVVFLVITSAVWCPRVGILVAFVVFFYLNDMNTLVTPLPLL